MTPTRRGERLKRVWPWLRVAGTIALLAFVIVRTDVEVLLASLRKLTARDFVVLLALNVLVTAMTVLRWRQMIRAVGLPSPSMRELVRLNMIGTFFNSFAPAGVGGDFVRAYALRGVQNGSVVAGFSILLFERALGFFALCVVAVACMLASAPPVPPEFLSAGLALCLACLLGVCTLAILPRLVHRLPVALQTRARAVVAPRRWSALLLPLAMSLASQGLLAASIVVLASTLGLSASWAAVAGIGMLALLTGFFPLSIGGLGPREVGFAACLAAIGVSNADAVVISLGLWAPGVVVALAGFPSVLRGNYRTSSAEDATPRP